MKKREPFGELLVGFLSWCSHYGKQWRFLKKFKLELPYDWAILLWGTYLKEMESLSQKDICTPSSLALFTIAKTWHQPKGPQMDDWIKKLWYVCNGLLLRHKKQEILPHVTNGGSLRNCAKWKRKTNAIWSHLYMESKPKQQSPELTDTENRSVVARGEGVGRWTKCTAYFNAAKITDLKNSHHNKKM